MTGASTGPSLRPVRGTAAEILALLRAWDAAQDPGPLVVETSGSTGEPKRVLLSRAAMRASADATHDRLGGPGQWLLGLPPSYVAGLQVLFRSVRADTQPVVAERHGVVAAARAMTEPRRYASLVPTQLRQLAGTDDLGALAGLDAVLVGGAALDGALRKEAVAAGVRLVTTYGMSETCGGCVYDGRPLDGVEVATDRGRVRIRGPVLFEGYQDRPELTAEVLGGGWFATSDLGHVEPDGTLRLEGRIDDVVVSGGVNVPLGAVGERLRAHPGLRAAEVVGLHDEHWGELVVAVVVVEVVVGLVGVDGGPSDGDLRDWVAATHPRTWAPRRVVRTDAIPLLPHGKVDRLAIERTAREGGAG